MEKLRRLLKNELVSRQSKNKLYSLRAFSRDLQVSTAALSSFLNGRRELSKKNIQQIVKKLKLSALEYDLRVSSLSQIKNESSEDVIAPETLNEISDWYFFALLNLGRTLKCTSDEYILAEQLALEPRVIKAAIEKLVALKYLKIVNKTIIRTTRRIRTTSDVPSQAIKKLHRSFLQKSAAVLNTINPSDREFISLCIASQSSKLPLAKEILRKFVAEMNNSLDGSKNDQVYTLNIQFYPLLASQKP